MYCKARKYTVTSDVDKFEETYGRSGIWFSFFESCDDFLGQELMKSTDPKIYMVLEKWISEEDYKKYISENDDKYQQIKADVSNLFDEEVLVGDFIILQ